MAWIPGASRSPGPWRGPRTEARSSGVSLLLRGRARGHLLAMGDAIDKPDPWVAALDLEGNVVRLDASKRWEFRDHG